jgi:TPP-dependent 2-oxoacid decarboxylase
MINSSQMPVIIAGVEIQPFALQSQVSKLIEKTGIPVVATILSKSVISEDHPSCLGLYEGAIGYESVREYVESSDCLIFLGAFMTDIDFGISATPVDSKNIINVTSEKLTIRHHTFDNVGLQAFISNLITADIRAREPQYLRNRNNGSPVNCFSAEICKKITVQCLFHRLASFITLDTIVIADRGDSLRCS